MLSLNKNENVSPKSVIIDSNDKNQNNESIERKGRLILNKKYTLKAFQQLIILLFL